MVLAGCGGSSLETENTRTLTFAKEAGDASPGKPPAGAAACETLATDAEALRATGVSCERARQVMRGWLGSGACAKPAGASRVSCATRSYRCAGTRADRGIAVSCSRPGESVAFIARRG